MSSGLDVLERIRTLSLKVAPSNDLEFLETCRLNISDLLLENIVSEHLLAIPTKYNYNGFRYEQICTLLHLTAVVLSMSNLHLRSFMIFLVSFGTPTSINHP